ncbi:PepSY domain-containing protein [Inhella gelatinilytica]|uniref:PepSY domain-containing protein n=1 Tax=Inhella gelatinilytica TaxID=2795030 RepID=A0A931IT95_9BURK|nr:PepSY domain-containing protein [Inhella gelatinilytica]MBH9551577.1 PepSY domain-containing protein [Inhella gelatinilytica]
MTWGARFFRWHRWLGWIVAVQVLAWVLGGVIFSWVPFKAWVKAEADVARPVVRLPAGWAAALAAHLDREGGQVLQVSSVATARGPALRLRLAEGERWVDMAGQTLSPPDEAAVREFARQVYRGPAERAIRIERLERAPRRLGIVRELPGARPLWCVHFDDARRTRLYVDARSGELLAVRNDAWVLYDFFWRLHLMDYSEGEDFNHPLIQGATALALGLTLTGLVLAVLAARRSLRRRRSP